MNLASLPDSERAARETARYSVYSLKPGIINTPGDDFIHGDGVDAAKISEAGKYAKIELNQYTCCEGERGGETTVYVSWPCRVSACHHLRRPSQ